MNTGARDVRHLRDRSGQLSLEGPTVIQLLHKLRHAQCRPIKDFKANAAAMRQPLTGHLQPQIVDLRARHEDRGAACAQFIGHFRLF